MACIDKNRIILTAKGNKMSSTFSTAESNVIINILPMVLEFSNVNNTGKYTGKDKLEDTIYKVNKEATTEICHCFFLLFF